MRRPLLLLLALLAGGCVSRSILEMSMEQRLIAQVHERGLPLDQVTVPFSLTPEMRKWAHEHVPAVGGADLKLDMLLRALLSSDGGVRLVYESGFTGTAAEVFSSGRANCLAFTHTFVGFAREVGIDAYYMRVDEVNSYFKQGDLIVASGHITAGYGSPGQRKVLDFTEQPVGPYHTLRPISDLTAVALFHSNRGAEILREGKLSEARRWLEVAVRLDPELPDGWVNLGVARRRQGDLDGAEEAYRRALEADPQQAAAYQNLAALVDLRGRSREAKELLALLEQIKSRNPFSYIALGDLNLSEGRLEDAERFYRRALRLDPQQAESYAALGEWAATKGRSRDAYRFFRQAAKLDPANERTRRLAERLGETLPSAPAGPSTR